MSLAPSKKSLERRVRALEARVEMLESLLRALAQASPRRPACPSPVSPAGWGRVAAECLFYPRVRTVL